MGTVRARVLRVRQPGRKYDFFVRILDRAYNIKSKRSVAISLRADSVFVLERYSIYAPNEISCLC